MIKVTFFILASNFIFERAIPFTMGYVFYNDSLFDFMSCRINEHDITWFENL